MAGAEEVAEPSDAAAAASEVQAVPEVETAAVVTAEAEAAPSAFAFTQPAAVHDEPSAAAAGVAAEEDSAVVATEVAGTLAAASGGVDAGASRLAALRNSLEEAEDQMQNAVDNDDFDAASELQEVVDELTDEIETLEASL